jgi:hypothetical protein
VIVCKPTARPACMEQAFPNLTSPRVFQSPKGAGACLAGLNKLLFGDPILGELVFVLSCTGLSIDQDHPTRHKSGSSYLILQEVVAFAEIRPVNFGLWCAKHGNLSNFRSWSG